MKALILAAGFGTRLGEIVKNTPKPLLTISGKPAIHYLILKLENLGVKEIYVNTHYLHEKFVDYFKNSEYKSKIHLCYEYEIKGTAGTLKSLYPKLHDDNFFVLHADNFFEDSLSNLLQFHLKTNPTTLLTLGTIKIEDPKLFGTLELDKEKNVTRFSEKDEKSTSFLGNSAIYIMKPEIFEIVNLLTTHETDISLHLIPKLLGRIKACSLSGYFIDIGTPTKLALARFLISGNNLIS